MKQKRLLVLLGILALLLVVAWAAGTFDRNVSTIDVPDIGIAADQIEALAVISPDLSIRLAREGDRWKLTEPVAGAPDSMTVKRLQDGLESLRIRSVVSGNPARHAEFGVDSTGKAVVVEAGRGTTTMVLGNPGPDFTSTYVRLGGDDNVYLADGRVTVPTDLDQWRDKTILRLPAREVVSARISRPEGEFEVSAAETGGWQVDDGRQSQAADSLAVAQWLTRLGRFQAVGIVDDADPTAVRDSVTHHLRLRTSSGTPVEIWIQSKATDAAVITSVGDLVYRVYNSVVDRYVPPGEDLLPDSDSI